MVHNLAPPLALFWCHLNMIIKEKTAPPFELAVFSKASPGWSRFGSSWFLTEI